MSFLAPWALAIAGIGVAATVLLHLVARSRPAAYLLPTTRFIPDRRTLVSRAATRPRDLLLLALRVLLLLAAGAAFARPVLSPTRGAVARIVLLDRSRAVADHAGAEAKARALLGDPSRSTLIVFDSAARVVPVNALADSVVRDSLARVAAREGSSLAATGSISAALVAARRAAPALAARADSVELVLVSPVGASELDAATSRIRAAWPGAIRIERVALRSDSALAWHLERAPDMSDVLGPASASLGARGGALTTRVVRSAFSAQDSAFARAGNMVVRWDSTRSARLTAEGLHSGDVTLVATLGRRGLPSGGRAIARWADGTAAAVEQQVGAGCLRDVGVVVPAAGDLALHAPFQEFVRAMLVPCGVRSAARTADSASVAMLSNGATGKQRGAAAATLLRGSGVSPSTLTKWLLALALFLALAELGVRTLGAPDAEVA